MSEKSQTVEVPKAAIYEFLRRLEQIARICRGLPEEGNSGTEDKREAYAPLHPNDTAARIIRGAVDD